MLFRNEDRVLALRDSFGLNLPSSNVPEMDEPLTGTDIRLHANGLFKSLTRKEARDDTLRPLYRGRDDEWGISSSYLADHPWKKLPKGAEWADPRDVMLGRWGLYARDVFHAAGVINRPRLSMSKIYRICELARTDASRNVQEAVDMVIDEVHFLFDIGKPWGVEAILREVDVRRLHADVIDALKTMVEDEECLPSGRAFVAAASAQIAEIDKLRIKIRFNGIADVRAAAAKIYKKKGKEFGDDLRAGRLSQKFPHMKHIADAEARMRGGDVQDHAAAPVTRPEVPFEAWPAEWRAAPPGARVDAVPKENPKDPRGVTLEERRPWTPVRLNEEPARAPSPFVEKIRRAVEEARHRDAPTPITFDGERPSVACGGCGMAGQTGRYCSECGFKLPRTTACPGCGYDCSLISKFCPECGSSLRPN